MSETTTQESTDQAFTGEAAGVEPGTKLPEFEGAGTSLARFANDTPGSMSVFASAANYEAAKKMATALSQSGMVPVQYQGKIANCILALEVAGRTGASVFAVMQNLHIIQGRPSWSSAFLIGSVNSSGRFTSLRYEFHGEPMKPGWKVRASARDLRTGESLEGTWITTEMVNAEGWSKKNGSKWLTMPEQMGRYRAAAFWVRAFAPEISLGMHTNDELDDFVTPLPGATAGAQDINSALAQARSARPAQAKASISEETAKSPTLVKGVECGECGAKKGEPHKEACPLVD